ncbi:MAG: ABC transporter substrate-binding protein [Desulfomonile tiedjei]|uniref:ABC transporter substrate-binding protein n=1 Tax=Desulfomonile tiedjei TaxID=2358 RepID=A0A9D6Z508_9BACT|nr:ABC transporter substrate-binding protein [Desulfomonile tiedjei]
MKKSNVGQRLIVALILSLAIIQGAMAEELITIAATLPITGPKSVADGAPPLEAALKDCVAITNEEGGIAGKRLRYVMEDDQYKPDVGLRVFEDLMAKYKPMCVFGSGTPVAVATAPVIRDRHKVLYTSTSFSAKCAFSGAPSAFVVGPTYGDQVAVALKYIAQQKKGTKVAFFYSQGPLGEDPIPYGRIQCRRLRLDLVGEAVGPINGGDCAAQIEQLKGKNPDWVILHGWVGATNAPLIKQCRDLGLKSELLVTLWGAQKSVVEALGPDGPTFLAVSPYAYWWMEDVPMINKLRAYTAKNYPQVTDRSLAYIVAFTAGKIFVGCLRQAAAAGEFNEVGTTKALLSLKSFDTGGLTPPLTIKENRFPIARILKSNPAKGIFEPVSDWIEFY